MSMIPTRDIPMIFTPPFDLPLNLFSRVDLLAINVFTYLASSSIEMIKAGFGCDVFELAQDDSNPHEIELSIHLKQVAFDELELDEHLIQTHIGCLNEGGRGEEPMVSEVGTKVLYLMICTYGEVLVSKYYGHEKIIGLLDEFTEALNNFSSNPQY